MPYMYNVHIMYYLKYRIVWNKGEYELSLVWALLVKWCDFNAIMITPNTGLIHSLVASTHTLLTINFFASISAVPKPVIRLMTTAMNSWLRTSLCWVIRWPDNAWYLSPDFLFTFNFSSTLKLVSDNTVNAWWRCYTAVSVCVTVTLLTCVCALL